MSVDFLRRTGIKMLPARYHEDIIFTAELATYNPTICKMSDLIYVHRSRRGSLYQISRSISAVHLLSKIKNGLNEDSHDYNILETIFAHRITLPYQEGELDVSNDNIKICENIDTCQFVKEEINNKPIIKVKIQIGEENKLQQYVMKNGEQEGASIKEEDYILNRLIESSNVTTE